MNDTARRDGVQKLLSFLEGGDGVGWWGGPGRGHQLAQVLSAASATASVCLLRLLVVVRNEAECDCNDRMQRVCFAIRFFAFFCFFSLKCCSEKVMEAGVIGTHFL